MKSEKSYRELGTAFYNKRDERSYNELYKKVKPGLKSYVWNILKDDEATDDVLSNTLTKLWTKIDQYNPDYQITTWLYKIAFNESLGYIRERNKKYSLDSMREFGIEVSSKGNIGDSTSLLLESDEIKTEDDFWEEENEIMKTYALALKCIQELKPMYKDILSDRLIEKMKYEDIAVKRSVSLQTVKNRIRRGKFLIINSMKS